MTTEDLIKELSLREKIAQHKAKKLVKAFIKTLEIGLKKGEKIVFSNFGTFQTHRYPSRTIRDPRGRGHKVLMLDTNVIKWHPSPTVRVKANKADTAVKESDKKADQPMPEKNTEQTTKKAESVKKEGHDIPITIKKPVTPDKIKVESVSINEKIPVEIKENKKENQDKTPEKITEKPEPKKEEKPIGLLAKLRSHLIHEDKPKSSAKVIDHKNNEPEEKSVEETKKAEDKSKEDTTVKKILPDLPISNISSDSSSDALPDNIVSIKKIDEIKSEIGSEGSQNKAEASSATNISDTANQAEKALNINTDTGAPNPEPQKFESENQNTPKLSKEEISEVTKSSIRPRISFEEFVRKSKEDIFSETPDTDEQKESTDNGDLDTPADIAKAENSNKAGSKPYLGVVNVEFIDLSKMNVNKDVLALIPEKFARQYQIVPVDDDGNVITVAMTDPEDLETIELVKKQTGREVIPKLTVQSDLNRILDQYSGIETEVVEAISESESQAEEDKVEKGGQEKQQKVVEDAPVARIVQSIIKRAVRELASDIHIEPNETGMDVRYRVDGVLQKKVVIPKDIQNSVISRVKILSGIKIDESRLPQDGRIQMNIDNRRVDFRVSTMPTAFGEKIVMRILDKSAGVLSLEDLGMRGKGFDVVENGIHKSHGMTLVTGPTGSGKTTTLYAIIDRLLDVAVNIVTLEDPIEYQMPGVNQSQVNADINYSFANGLRSILRQDPDVVMIGEIRDKETAEMAVNAALTGHVVLSTLHTNDAAGAGPRLIDMGVEPFLITSSLNTIIAQRLARRICKNCKEEVKVPDKELEEVKKEIEKMPEDIKKKWQGKNLVFYHGKGCENCHNTGYKGRLGVFEVLDVLPNIQELLLSRATSGVITETAIKNGMLTIKQDGIDKALDGMTSLEEVWRVTKD